MRRKVPAKFKKLLKKTKTSKTLKSKITKVVKSVINREAETKSGLVTMISNVEIQNNFWRQACTNFLATGQGVGDNETLQGARIGDRIKLKGVHMKLLLESNSRFSEVWVRIIVIKKYRGAAVTNNTHTSQTGLFRNLSVQGNAIMDEFDNEKHKCIYQKLVKLRLGNDSISDNLIANAPATALLPSGLRWANGTDKVGMGATYRWSKYFTAKQLGFPSGTVTYENNSTVIKNWDYEVWVGTHTGLINGPETGGSAYNLCAINQGYVKMYYKDM